MKKRKTKEQPAATEGAQEPAPADAVTPAAPAFREDIPTQPYFEPPVLDVPPAAAEPSWDGPTRVAEPEEIADLTAQSASAEPGAEPAEASEGAESGAAADGDPET